MIVRFRADARNDWHDAVLHYEEQREGLGVEFVRAVREAFREIAAAPHRWPTYTEHTRAYRLAHFPYRIVYSIEPDGLVVYAVMHTKRDDGYWKNRLERPPR